MEKIEVRETIIVEGKYDKIKLQDFISSPIIETNGFRIFKDKEKINLIRETAQKRGILILTDSDSAGFIIRNHIRGCTENGMIFNAYIPQILGKEKRKDTISKEGYLGVEGIDKDILIDSIKRSGATIVGESNTINIDKITKSDFYEWGLLGKNESKIKREEILKKMNLPLYLSTNAMIMAINSICSKDEFLQKYMN